MTQQVEAGDVVWFPSKVDHWLWVVLILSPLGAIAATVALAVQGDQAGVVVGLVTCVGLGALYGLLVWPVCYGVGPDQLTVRFGIVRYRVPLARIRAVRPSRSLLGAPALSLDRLAVVSVKGSAAEVLISPADREGFLALLADRAGLQREGDALQR